MLQNNTVKVEYQKKAFTAKDRIRLFSFFEVVAAPSILRCLAAKNLLVTSLAIL